MMTHYFQMLDQKYQKQIVVEWIFWIVALLSLVAVVGYGVYCTWSGGSFTGSLKFGIPNLISVSIGCKR
ncbi:hypothetical protein [Pseudolactococcus piscium]|nr:hypothetical protein [Lactococcus piscium]